MKLFALLLLASSVVSVNASPLIFKADKTLSPGAEVEIASFDATKYKQIRIGVSSNNVGWTQRIRINAVDGDDLFILLFTEERFLGKTFLIETPPPMIRIMIDGKGLYKIRVWGDL